jgi:beta-lactamase class A
MNTRVSRHNLIKLSLIFLAGGLLGWFISSTSTVCSHGGKEVRLISGRSNHSLTNPLLGCEMYVPSQPGFAALKHELVEYIDDQIKQGKASHISVYVRDLNNGPWVGIGEKDDFSPASLLKIPVMVAFYKLAETDPAILRRLVLYDPAKIHASVPVDVPPVYALKPNQSYSINELIMRMILYSDNISTDLLLSNMDARFFNQVMLDLQLKELEGGADDDFISVKQYASVFRILYNASYLSRPLSEKALKLLTQTEFSEGITAGLPKGIVAAHKFGERENGEGKTQLHECAIVYVPLYPYLLCIMTKGRELPVLKTILKDISNIAYQRRVQ